MARACGEWSAEEGWAHIAGWNGRTRGYAQPTRSSARFCCWEKASSGGVQPACGVMAPDEVGTGAEGPGACITFVADARHRSCLANRFDAALVVLLGLPLPIPHARVRWTLAWHNYTAQSQPRAAERSSPWARCATLLPWLFPAYTSRGAFSQHQHTALRSRQNGRHLCLQRQPSLAYRKRDGCALGFWGLAHLARIGRLASSTGPGAW